MFEYIDNVHQVAAHFDGRARFLAEAIEISRCDLTRAGARAMRRALARVAAEANDRREALAGIRRRAVVAIKAAAEVAAANWRLNSAWDPDMKALVEPAIRRLAAALDIDDTDEDDAVLAICKSGAVRLTKAEMIGLRFCFTGR